MPKSKLNERQKAFIAAYAGNATEAALKAGYSTKTAYSQGQRLLKHVEIAPSIRERQNKQERKLIASREDRQKFWTDVMNDQDADMGDRLRAAELLGKSEADFTDVQRHEGKINVLPPIKIDSKALKI